MQEKYYDHPYEELPVSYTKCHCLRRHQIRTGHWRSDAFLRRILKRGNDNCWFCQPESRQRVARNHMLTPNYLRVALVKLSPVNVAIAMTTPVSSISTRHTDGHCNTNWGGAEDRSKDTEKDSKKARHQIELNLCRKRGASVGLSQIEGGIKSGHSKEPIESLLFLPFLSPQFNYSCF